MFFSFFAYPVIFQGFLISVSYRKTRREIKNNEKNHSSEVNGYGDAVCGGGGDYAFANQIAVYAVIYFV